MSRDVSRASIRYLYRRDKSTRTWLNYQLIVGTVVIYYVTIQYTCVLIDLRLLKTERLHVTYKYIIPGFNIV